MPCICYYPEENVDYTKKYENLTSSLEEMLCSACRVLEKGKYDFDENPQLSKWWDAHKKEDEKRQAAEAKIQREIEQCKILNNKSLASLTKDEKSLLSKHGYL